MGGQITLVRGWPTGPAVVAGAFMGIIGLGATVFAATVLWWGITVVALGAVGMLAFMWSSGQLVNHLNHGEPNWAQGGLVAALTLALLMGSELLRWYTEPLITGPFFALALGAGWAYGLTRWVSWVVREPEKASV